MDKIEEPATPVTLPLKSKPTTSDILTFNSACDDNADEIIEDDKPGADDSSSLCKPCVNILLQPNDLATAQACSTPPSPSTRS